MDNHPSSSPSRQQQNGQRPGNDPFSPNRNAHLPTAAQPHPTSRLYGSGITAAMGGIQHSVVPQQQQQAAQQQIGQSGAAVLSQQQRVQAASASSLARPSLQQQTQQRLQQQYAASQQQQQQQAWGVPNPLNQTTSIASARPSQQFAASAVAQSSLPSVTAPANQTMQSNTAKKKVVLSAQAKQALAKAIWSAIRHPTGQVDPNLMEAALKTGLPQNAILNAAKVAREREALKRSNKAANATSQRPQSNPSHIAASQQMLAQRSAMSISSGQSLPRPIPQVQQVLQQNTQHRPVISQQSQLRQQPATHRPTTVVTSSASTLKTSTQQQQIEQQKRARIKASHRAHWRRAQSGVFMLQKERFLAVPFSVGAIEQSGSMKAILQDPSSQPPQENKPQGIPKKPSTVKLLNPDSYKRHKVEPKKYSKQLERAAKKSRQGLHDVLTKQHKELHKALSSHQSEFFKFHKACKADLAKVCKTVRDSLDREARKRGKDAVAAEKARLAALRANDMNAYSQLLEETRNERLQFLLSQTESHFTQISSLLHQERGSSDNSAEGTSSYYQTAHKMTEEVRQPSILVGGDLKEYQLTGLQWMVSLYNNRLNGILADEMGLGKTIQAISLVAYLMEFKQNLGPYLVVVPLSTLSNWQNEFQKWCPAARLICYKGTPGQRKTIYKDQVSTGHFNVLLTTYEYIIKDKKFLRKIEWQYAIVDEGHRMKNAQSKFAVTLGTMYTTKYRILLTGTPLMNDLSELWSLLNFLLPSIFNSVDTFDQWFSRPFEQFGGTNDEGDDLLSNEERILVIHRLHELLRPFMLRRVKSEVLDQLPEKVEKVLRCDLSSWQKELYKQISVKAVEDHSLLGNGSQPQSRGLNNIVMQLRKVCNHPYLFSPEGYHINDTIVRSSGKIALLDQMLPKLKVAGHRVLMFTQMTAVMTILEDFFGMRGYLSLRLDGSTPAEEREKRMYKFNAPDSPYFIFLLSTRAGGLGLNLTSADTVIIFDSDWNPMMDLQAQDRAHRIGQRSDVSVFRLITYSPVEEKILSRATEKLNVSELVVESGKFNKESVESDNSLERKRIMEVLLTDFDSTQPKDTATEKTGSDEADDDDDNSETSEKEDANEMLSNNEVDYQLYAAIDAQVRASGGVRAPLFTRDEDIPDWIKYPQKAGGNVFTPANPLADEGSRKRKAVMYDDGMTEKQFLRAMEKQAIAEEQQAKKRPKLSKSPVAAAKPSQEEEAPVRSDSLLTDWTFRKLISCSKSVVALKDPVTKRRLSDIFLEKPDPATFPDYYEIIEKPISINDILRKCRAKLYSNLQEFNDDWALMFANAKKFNGDPSWVVDDAAALDKELQRVLKKNGFSADHIPSSKKSAEQIPSSMKSPGASGSKGTNKKLRIKLKLKGPPTT